jgi:hypothetical protein
VGQEEAKGWVKKKMELLFLCQKDCKKKGKGGSNNNGKKKNPWLGGRPGMVPRLGPMLCPAFAEGTCKYGDKCKNNHNVDLFLSQKPADVSARCHVFETFGYCSDGIKCRFSAAHIAADGKTNIVDSGRYEQHRVFRETKFPADEEVLHQVTKGKYPLDQARAVIERFETVVKDVVLKFV